jgi:histidinol-phosphate aminotransferase
LASHLDKIKESVRKLRAYSLKPDRGAIKINQNENPFGTPERIKREVLARMTQRSWERYPDFIPTVVREKLASFCDWTPEGIVVGNGSNELIQSLLMVSITEGRRVLISEPTFALYRQVATVLGGEIKSIPLKEDLTYDIDELLSAVETFRPDVTIICSPNNPTGCVIEDQDLSRLLDATTGLVAIDEAYYEFRQASAKSLIARYPNLVVFRTFSKAMALAGLRVGYLIAVPEIATEVSKSVLPYNLNLMSQIAAEVTLEMYTEELLPLVDMIIKERDLLYESLKAITGLEPLKSSGNFMVVRSSISPKRVYDELLNRDILIRDVSGYPMLQDYFRVSVGTPSENASLISALKEIFSETSGRIQ